MGAVREVLKHARGVEIPHGGPRHNEEAVGSEEEEVHGRVDLFHESRLFRTRANAEVEGHWTDESLHEEFAGEGEHDDVEGHEGKIARTFAIVCRRAWVAGVRGNERIGGREGVGEEDGAVKRVGGCGVYEVGGEDERS